MFNCFTFFECVKNVNEASQLETISKEVEERKRSEVHSFNASLTSSIGKREAGERRNDEEVVWYKEYIESIDGDVKTSFSHS